MFTYGFGRRCQPMKLDPARPDDPRVMDASTGNSGRDGYTRLSAADRETGKREPVGGQPVWPAYRSSED